jgi:NADH-quinone oxidoreductase subunit F
VDPVLLAANRDPARAASLGEYRDAGGYRALERVLREVKPEELIQIAKDSGLRGRGGAGFASGAKWSFMLDPQGRDGGPRYLVCNADEMEPGTFKDRVLIERNPHALIEGMVLASWAMSMTEAFVFIRREYFEPARRLEAALEEARRAGLLGERILGGAFSLDIHIHRSGGRYICGEETALLNAFEGRRANPRSKPPYPATHGLWGRPTTVHNVETLACVPSIADRGAAWFKGLARNPEGAGPKLYGGSGAVERPACLERPIGTPLRELLADMGGVRGGKSLLGVIPGGASTPFLTADHLDVPMDFDPLVHAGSRLGTGTFIVLSEDDCPVRATLNLQRFFARESCGFCTPCREGLPFGVRLLEDLEEGRATRAQMDLIAHLYETIGPNSFCAHAAGAAEPVKGLYQHFRDILEAHVEGHGCPFGPAAAPVPIHA